jgi:hypothetical protein
MCYALKQCRFLEQQTFVSSDNILMLVLRRLGPPTSSTETDTEFLDGAFLFHDGKFRMYISVPKSNSDISECNLNG